MDTQPDNSAAYALSPSPSPTVYHFSDSAHLPWIAMSKELRAGANKIGGYPSDFLWATTDGRGDRTATAMVGYRKGQTLLVRFTLSETDFRLWPDILADHPEWTTEHRTRLERIAVNRGVSPDTWRCRDKPLPLSSAIKIEGKHYSSQAWKPLPLLIVELADDIRGIVFNEMLYAAQRVTLPSGVIAHHVAQPLPIDPTDFEHASMREMYL